MARTEISERVVVRERYFWPQGQLNLWTLIVLATGSTILGVFAEFMQIQSQTTLNTPWYVSFSCHWSALLLSCTNTALVQAISLWCNSRRSHRNLHNPRTHHGRPKATPSWHDDAWLLHTTRPLHHWSD
jgi:hypothetical protein